MITPAASNARGMFRRAFFISLPIVEAPSTPPNANATVDQKKTFFKSSEGTTVARSMAVAEPNLNHGRQPLLALLRRAERGDATHHDEH